MSWNFQDIKEGVEKDVEAIKTSQELEDFRIKYVGRKGLISQMYASLASASKEEKPTLGKNINDLKLTVTKVFEEKKAALDQKNKQGVEKNIDVTIPGVYSLVGHSHLLSQTIEEICDIFEKLGFVVQEGPEIETEENNFTALNIPKDHPSRDGFDTFYLDKKRS